MKNDKLDRVYSKLLFAYYIQSLTLLAAGTLPYATTYPYTHAK